MMLCQAELNAFFMKNGRIGINFLQRMFSQNKFIIQMTPLIFFCKTGYFQKKKLKAYFIAVILPVLC